MCYFAQISFCFIISTTCYAQSLDSLLEIKDSSYTSQASIETIPINRLIGNRYTNQAPISIDLFDNYGFIDLQNTVVNISTDSVSSLIDYEIGLNRFQLFNLRHSQLIGRGGRLAIDFKRNTWDGIYDNQEHNLSDLTIFLKKDLNNWKGNIILNYKYSDNGSNGGLIDIGEFTDTIQNRAFIDVNNNTAIVSYRDILFDFELLNQITSNFSVGGFINLNRLDFSYSDESVVDNITYYQSILIDSSVTFDGYKEGYEIGGIKLLFRDDLVLRLGGTRQYYRNKSLSDYLGIYGNIGWKKDIENHKFLIDAEVNYNSNQLYSRVELKGNTRNELINAKYNLTTTYGILPAFYESYVSNHFEWENKFKEPISINADIEISDKKTGVVLDGTIVNAHNYIQWSGDSLGGFNQSNIIQSAFLIDLSREFQLSDRFKLKPSYNHFNQFSGTLFRYPNHKFSLDLVLNGSLFKDKLKYEISIDFNYRNAYLGYDYEPIVYAFYAGSRTEELGDFFHTNATLKMFIADVEIFLRMRHLDEGLYGYDYFDFYNYPGKDRLLSFGIKVQFND